MVTFEIANGARLVCEKTDRFKISSISLSLALPLSNDSAAYGILAYLLCNSCEKYKTYRELHARLEELYGASLSVGVSKSGDAQVISIYLSAINDRFSFDNESVFESSISLLFDLVFNPNLNGNAFLNEDVEKQKRMQIERIEAEQNEKRTYAVKACEKVLFKNEKAGIPVLGEISDVKKLMPEKLYEAYNKLIETATMQLVIVGNCDETFALNAFKSRLLGVKRNPVKIETEFIKAAKKVNTVEEKMQVAQSKLVMGYRAGMANSDDNFAAIRIMTDIFGGSPHSKLFTNVREKQGLCYYCGARLSGYKGVIMVQSGVENKNRLKAVEEINKQLEDIKNGDFTDNDIAASKASLLDSFSSVSDTPEGLNRYYDAQIIDEKVETPEEFSKGFVSVTREQIIDAAKNVTLDTVYMLSGGEDK